MPPEEPKESDFGLQKAARSIRDWAATGFPITVRPGMDRARLVQWLEDARIETRLVFSGNIVHQPGFLHIERRVHGDLTASDTIMRDTLFIGLYPGLTEEMIAYVLENFRAYFSSAPKSGPLVSHLWV